MNWSVRPYLAAHAALLGFTLMALSLWFARDAVVPWDSKNQFYPLFRFLSGSLAEGEVHGQHEAGGKRGGSHAPDGLHRPQV